MHMFVKQYVCLQYTPAYENYEVRQTKLGGVVVHHNLDIERHASKIYTWAMLEQFGQMIYSSFAYRVGRDREGHDI